MFDLTLSFDNGPEPDVTPRVLDALAARGIRATFFVIGEKLDDPARRAIAERAHDQGHWIGNHTLTHSVAFGDSAVGFATREIERTETRLGRLAHPDRLFRPYAGGGAAIGPRLLNQEAIDVLTSGGHTCVLWNAVPHDWEDAEGWVDRAMAQCLAQPWSLMVLHDLPTGAMPHLPRLIDRVVEAGGHFRQEFPPSAVPIRAGRIVLPIDAYVSPRADRR